MINTSYLGLHYFRHQSPPGGSIVCTASAAAFQRFRVADYTAAKHGVLGWMRGIVPNILDSKFPIRVNAIAPSWTLTGLIPEELVEVMGQYCEWQGPEVVARSVIVLMADGQRQGQLIYSVGGKFWEIEEEKFLPTAKSIVGSNDEDFVVRKLQEVRADVGYGAESKEK